MNTQSADTNSQNGSSHDVSEEKSREVLHLPEPDPENITVLTDKLPNKPILPWNRYDSPWDEIETKKEEEAKSEENNHHDCPDSESIEEIDNG